MSSISKIIQNSWKPNLGSWHNRFPWNIEWQEYDTTSLRLWVLNQLSTVQNILVISQKRHTDDWTSFAHHTHAPMSQSITHWLEINKTACWTSLLGIVKCISGKKWKKDKDVHQFIHWKEGYHHTIHFLECHHFKDTKPCFLLLESTILWPPSRPACDHLFQHMRLTIQRNEAHPGETSQQNSTKRGCQHVINLTWMVWDWRAPPSAEDEDQQKLMRCDTKVDDFFFSIAPWESLRKTKSAGKKNKLEAAYLIHSCTVHA